MSMHPNTNAIEAVAIFQDIASLDNAVEALFQGGFGKDDISLLASEKTVEDKLGHRYEHVDELEDDPEAPRVALSFPYRLRRGQGLGHVQLAQCHSAFHDIS